MEFITKKLDFSNQTIKEMKINSKNFYNLIKTRRSVRDFKKNNINFDIIKSAILAAGTAPNGANLQPWHFVIIKKKSIKKKIRIAAEKVIFFDIFNFPWKKILYLFLMI